MLQCDKDASINSDLQFYHVDVGLRSSHMIFMKLIGTYFDLRSIKV
jgi:hypothetical protein